MFKVGDFVKIRGTVKSGQKIEDIDILGSMVADDGRGFIIIDTMSNAVVSHRGWWWPIGAIEKAEVK